MLFSEVRFREWASLSHAPVKGRVPFHVPTCWDLSQVTLMQTWWEDVHQVPLGQISTLSVQGFMCQGLSVGSPGEPGWSIQGWGDSSAPSPRNTLQQTTQQSRWEHPSGLTTRALWNWTVVLFPVLFETDVWSASLTENGGGLRELRVDPSQQENVGLRQTVTWVCVLPATWMSVGEGLPHESRSLSGRLDYGLGSRGRGSS